LGLGLAISRALVELHSGIIRADSPGKGKGATFSVELPLAKDDEKAESASAELSLPAIVPTKQISSKGIHILLVEDHEPTRVGLAHLLLRRHYKVTSVGSLAEARALLEKEHFHLLISDIGLPDGNGCDLMKELRERFHIKGIALTGYGMENDLNRSYAAGFSAHLTKPVRIESLDEALTVAMNP
jgi:CheY-like chemotaxis protein